MSEPIEPPLIQVQCDTCKSIHLVRNSGSFPRPCGLCKPPGRGQVSPV